MVVVTIAHVTGIEAGLWIKAGGDHFAEDGISLLPELLVVVRFHMLFEIATMRQIRNKSKHLKNDSKKKFGHTRHYCTSNCRLDTHVRCSDCVPKWSSW